MLLTATVHLSFCTRASKTSRSSYWHQSPVLVHSSNVQFPPPPGLLASADAAPLLCWRCRDAASQVGRRWLMLHQVHYNNLYARQPRRAAADTSRPSPFIYNTALAPLQKTRSLRLASKNSQNLYMYSRRRFDWVYERSGTSLRYLGGDWAGPQPAHFLLYQM